MTKRFGLCCIAAVFTMFTVCRISGLAQGGAAYDIHRVDFRNFSYSTDRI